MRTVFFYFYFYFKVNEKNKIRKMLFKIESVDFGGWTPAGSRSP